MMTLFNRSAASGLRVFAYRDLMTPVVLRTGFINEDYFRLPRRGMATISGWAYPADYPSPRGAPNLFDHTYVVSSNGKRWKCHGGDRGGSRVTAGNGRYKFAKCLGRGECGIVYAVTGVCHQMANRILFSAGRTVVKAKGVLVTSAFYGGMYGEPASWAARLSQCKIEDWIPPIRLPRIPRPRLPWKFAVAPEIELRDFSSRSPRLDVEDDVESVESDEDVQLLALSDEEATYFDILSALYTSGANPAAISAADLELSVRMKLGDRVTDQQLRELASVRHEIATRYSARADGFITDFTPVDKKDFLVDVDDMATEMFQKFSRVLGDERYIDAFEVDPKLVSSVVNPYSNTTEEDSSLGFSPYFSR